MPCVATRLANGPILIAFNWQSEIVEVTTLRERVRHVRLQPRQAFAAT